MNISEVFIRRPVATVLLMVGLLAAGMLAYQQLPVAALPQVDYPTIVVATMLPGASADTMATTVTTPLERQLGQMPALSQMTSVSSFGSSQITLQFNLERSIDAAEQDVQAAINAASNLLPSTLPTPPTYSKSNPADTPILTLAVRSEALPLSEVDDYADSILAQKIAQVSGVGLVTLNGGQKPAVRVQVDPQALAGLNLTMEDIRSVLSGANVNQAKGNLDGTQQSYALATDDQLYKAAAYKELIISYNQAAAVRLGDVAEVLDGVENTQLAAWSNAQRAIILQVQRQPGANIIAVADRIKTLLPLLRASAPQGLDIDILSDRTQTVRASVRDVQQTLLLTIVLVILVIFAFLRDVWATLIPGVAVPLSLVGTFGVMYLLGYSLDNLSLMALTISTGFVVDDAIVMIENISRYLEAGATPLKAALQGAAQIGFTIISLTVSLIAVLIPLLFMGGIIGRLFREFAVTLSVAIAVSALLSLSLTPMMCAQLLRTPSPQQAAVTQQPWYAFLERGFTQLLGAYERSLKRVLQHQRLTLLVALGSVLLTGWLFFAIPKGFFPQQDTGLILGTSEAAADISFAAMAEKQQALAAVLRQDVDVAQVASAIGTDGTNPTANVGRFNIALQPWEKRQAGVQTIMQRLQQQAQSVQDIRLYLQAVQDLQIDSRSSRTQFQYSLEDAAGNELQAFVPRLVARLAALPQLVDVASDQQASGLQAHLQIDRATAARLGITPQMIDDTLYDAFGQRIVSTIFTQLNQYRVILEVKPQFAQDPRALEYIFVQSSAGVPVPLAAFTTLSLRATPLAISHQGQFAAQTISFNLAPQVALGEAVSAIETAFAALEPPTGLRGSFQGTAQAFQASLASEPLLVLAALVTVYIVLGVLYESYIHPITILSTLPSAGIGALLALRLCGQDFSIIAFIGIILLIGIVKKNAIMMIDFALEAERQAHMTPQAAIFQACLLRFRPIMMTTLAALLGGLPLALGQGAGAELRRPLGISIVGGLLVSQVLTLYTTPVIYLYMDKLGRFLRQGLRRPARKAA